MNDQKIDMNVSEDELLCILIQNPYFNKLTDEINEKSLYRWMYNETINKLGKRSTKRDILGLITKLTFDGIFIPQKVGRTILIKPTRKYTKLKNGASLEEIREEANKPIVAENNKTNVHEIKDNKQYEIYDNLSFYDILVSNMNNYKGENKGLLMNSPTFFELLCNILNDERSDWHTKMMISSALGYFVMDDDVIPDSHENGYVDDLFIICYVLKQIRKLDEKLIIENWNYESDICELIEDVFQESYRIIGNKACDTLQIVGLYKFKSLELEEYTGNYQDRVKKLAEEKREAIALVAYLVKQLYNVDMKSAGYKKLKDYITKYGDYNEVNRLIALSKEDREDLVDSNGYVDDHKAELEEKLRQARLKVLLEE